MSCMEKASDVDFLGNVWKVWRRVVLGNDVRWRIMKVETCFLMVRPPRRRRRTSWLESKGEEEEKIKKYTKFGVNSLLLLGGSVGEIISLDDSGEQTRLHVLG